MNQYEVMCVIKPDLSEEERKGLFAQIGDAVTKNGGTVKQAAIWIEKKKLWFRIKKHDTGTYYLVQFSAPSAAIAKLREAYRLNENILRILVIAVEKQRSAKK